MLLSTTAARAISQLSQPLLGCNVYISAGGLPRHVPILLDLLQDTQEHCSIVTSQQKLSDESSVKDLCVVVHAFSDVVYSRSSFHLAGSEKLLGDVVSKLVRSARQKLADENHQEEIAMNENNNVNHPFVGLVDHIAVMPLIDSSSGSKQEREDRKDFQPYTASGRAARTIGASMLGTSVFYYGTADPQEMPLAEVRRKKTRFFQSGGLEEEKPTNNGVSTSSSSEEDYQDVATIGAPLQFVENFNIRLTRNCNKKTAQSLTRFLRERDGGLPGVEALTLPYSRGRFEVACNLLQPQIGSSEAIDAKVHEWASMVTQEIPGVEGGYEYFVETSYRVGTTSDQCLNALALAAESDSHTLNLHNNQVTQNLKDFLSASQ